MRGHKFTRRGQPYLLCCYAAMEASLLPVVVFQNPRTGQFFVLPRTQFEEEFKVMVESRPATPGPHVFSRALRAPIMVLAEAPGSEESCALSDPWSAPAARNSAGC